MTVYRVSKATKTPVNKIIYIHIEFGIVSDKRHYLFYNTSSISKVKG